jgi:hypothetical protein
MLERERGSARECECYSGMVREWQRETEIDLVIGWESVRMLASKGLKESLDN